MRPKGTQRTLFHEKAQKTHHQAAVRGTWASLRGGSPTRAGAEGRRRSNRTCLKERS